MLLVGLAACAGHDALDYAWDDRRVLCSESVDDWHDDLNWGRIEDQLKQAADEKVAVMFHAHIPGLTIQAATLERILSTAEAYGLTTLTFRDLVPTTAPTGALVLAFDDNAPDEWFSIRDLLLQHHARVTFFVTRFAQWTPLGHDELQMLAADGHDIEAHTVNHIHGPAYVVAHGIDAYIADEVLPSLQILVDAGYPAPTTLAYPWGERTDEIDSAVLAHVAKVRTTAGPCPW
jgi:peptidoglycan/xylan/chitin deacetylase (PgdA/CDA1 family)